MKESKEIEVLKALRIENIKLLDEIKKERKKRLLLKKNIQELKNKYLLEVEKNNALIRILSNEQEC